MYHLKLIPLFIAVCIALFSCNSPINPTNAVNDPYISNTNPLRKNQNSSLKKIINNEDIVAVCGSTVSNQLYYRFAKRLTNGTLSWFPTRYLGVAYDRAKIAINSNGMVVIVSLEYGISPRIYTGPYDGNGNFNFTFSGIIPNPMNNCGNYNLHVTLNDYNELICTYTNNCTNTTHYSSGYIDGNTYEPYWRQEAIPVNLPNPCPSGLSIDIGGTSEDDVYATWQSVIGSSDQYEILGKLNWQTDYSLSFNSSTLEDNFTFPVSSASVSLSTSGIKMMTYRFLYSDGKPGIGFSWESMYYAMTGSGGWPSLKGRNVYDCSIHNTGDRVFVVNKNSSNQVYLSTSNFSNYFSTVVSDVMVSGSVLSGTVSY